MFKWLVEKFIGAIDQQRILFVAEIQMSAVTRDDHRQAAGHSFRGGKIEALSAGRKDDRIGHVIKKVHLPLVEVFGNDLDRGSNTWIVR